MKVRKSLYLALLAGVLAVPAAAGANDGLRSGHSFALIGDTPYGLAEEPKFDNVIADINQSRNVRFVLHTGDVKQGSELCSDEVLQRRFAQYQKFRMAFIVTPGDNDWTDCHRTNNGNYVPTERLAKFREIFYPEPTRSTGQRPAAVVPQSAFTGFEKYVENTLWRFNGTTMATVHVVGSNNNLAPWNQIDPADSFENPRADRLAEFTEREAAALAWIDKVFDTAMQNSSAGVLIAMQANPAFESATTSNARRGFNKVIEKIVARTIAFAKPVLVVHGDSHYFRIDKPLAGPVAPSGVATLENFTRVENFGSPNVHWVEIFVDRRDPNVFTAIPRVVKENFFPR
jgi:hypothetical protein